MFDRKEIVRSIVLVVLLLGSLAFPHQWAVGAALGVAAIAASWPTLRKAIAGTRQKKINIELFNSVALLASVALGEFASAAFIALMLAAARILDSITKRRARRAVEELIKLRPKTITVERGEKLIDVDPAELRSGDVVVVREGERIPVDGEVTEGESIVDEAPVTGESRPVLKVRGDHVLSPSINVRGMIKVAAERTGKDTMLERIIRLIEEAEQAKAPVQHLADRFSAWFLPVVLALAVGAYAWSHDPKMAIALLVVVCADDIAVSIPLAFFAAIGAAARSGVIVNGGGALERIGRAKAVLFDKTGTLTYGRPRIESVRLAEGTDEREFWTTVGAIEKYSKHPFVKALLDEVAAKGIVPADPEDFETVMGKGVRAVIGGKEHLAGNAAFLVSSGVSGVPDGLPDNAWCFSREGKFMGAVVVNDMARAGAGSAIRALRSLGVRRTVMLTGDAQDIAAKVAAELGIDEVRAKLLPEDKVKAVRDIREGDGVVVMVGDGINDAPALAEADVGVAMGSSGTTVSIETAQIVIMRDELDRLAETMRLSKRTNRVVIGDFAIWVVTNIIGIAAVFGGLLSPPAAALYNFLTDFLPLMNSAQLFGVGRKRVFRPAGDGSPHGRTHDVRSVRHMNELICR